MKPSLGPKKAIVRMKQHMPFSFYEGPGFQAAFVPVLARYQPGPPDERPAAEAAVETGAGAMPRSAFDTAGAATRRLLHPERTLLRRGSRRTKGNRQPRSDVPPHPVSQGRPASAAEGRASGHLPATIGVKR